MFGVKIGSVQHTIYDDAFDSEQDEKYFLHSHGVDYGDLTADGQIAQLVITQA